MSMNGQLRQIPVSDMDLLDDESVVERLMEAEGLDVGKAWNGLHFLYCGEGSAGESAISGGLPLDGPDTGYGPPQYLTPEEVADYADKLERLSDDKLRKKYVPADMTGEDVYPGGWDEAGADWLLGEAARVRAFYRDAANKGAGILQFLT